MTWRPLAVIRVALGVLAVSTAACSEKDFPVTPTPVANATVTTLSGGSWSGHVMLSNGTITTFNMTLIARGVGLSTGERAQAQAPGTVHVSGDYETGNGLRGTVGGALQGTLQNGAFEGIFSSDTPNCVRRYAGPITESSAALVPSGEVPPGCPLTFSVQISRERGPDCHYSISLDQQSFSGNGGGGVATVETGAGCTWAAESLAPWILVVDPAPKVGPGRIAFTVTSNGEGARDGQLRFTNPNQSVTIRQGPSCVFQISPANATVSPDGGTGSVALQGPSGCEWTAQSAVNWITVSPANGAGSATITFTAGANAGLARRGTFSVGGHTITVSQGAGCVLAVTPRSDTVPMGGGGGTISVAGVSGCGWTARTNVDWMTVAPAAGDGNGTVAYTAQANAGPPRQGTLTVAGQTVTIAQGTCNAPITVSVSLTNVPSGGTSGTVTVLAPAGCPWTATAPDWITLTPSGGTGNGSIAFTVSANSSSDRQGTLTVAGQALVITQLGGFD